MLINSSRLTKYFPNLSTVQLELAINSAQTIIESHLGANRSLTIKKYIELQNLPNSGKIQLKYLPILQNSIDYPIIIKVIKYGVNVWEELTLNEIDFDYEYGEIFLKNHIDYWTTIQNAPRSRNSLYKNFRPGQRMPKNQIRIQYYSGFDLNTEPLSDIAQSFKLALINFINFQSSESMKGIKSFELSDEYVIEYFSSGDTISSLSNGKLKGSKLDDMLAYFKQFRPRQMII